MKQILPVQNCPAKINLFLEVVSQREDGYHNIDTVMQKVGLSDTVSVALTDSGRITVSSDDPHIPSDEKNICYKAAKLYLDFFGIKGVGCEISICKIIPQAAGLGGGSSDAAGVLKALNGYFKMTDTDSLAGLSASVGADLPFFVCEHTAALCTGIGEIMTRCDPLSNGYLLLAKCSEGISAGEGYKALDSVKYDKRSSDEMLKALKDNDFESVMKNLYNSFEYAVFPLIGDAETAKNIMLSHSADGALMSGSGPTVAGFFKNEENALKAKNELLGRGYTVALTGL